MSLSVGDRLGRYEVLGPIGAGGMGEVWQARDSELGRQVAIKVLPEHMAAEPRRVERFHREARALAALSHPNLLEIHDVGSVSGLDYLVTELLEGDTLRAIIPDSGLPWQRVCEIGAAAADGLAAAHDKGILHRDLKPENVFVTSDGRVKILDFGLASVAEMPADDGESPTVTEEGTVLGTAGYTAPEQLRGRPADTRSDIFSLGCVLYEVASGQRAFGGDTSVEMMAAILKESPPGLSSSGARVPVDLERTVHRCLEKRPNARFQSAADLAYSLKSLGASLSTPVMATRAPMTAGSPTTRNHRRWLVPLTFTGLVLAVVFAWWALTQQGDDRIPVEAVVSLDPTGIAVVPFANQTGDASLDALGRRAADRIIRELADVDEFQVAPVNVVTGIARGRAALGIEARSLVHDVATATSSGLVLVGVIYTPGDEIEIQATLENAASGHTVRSFDTLRSPRHEVDASLDTLAGWVFITAMEELHPSLRFGAGDRIPDPSAFREYLAAMQIAGFDPRWRDHLWKALELDPEFDRFRLRTTIGLWRLGDWQLADQLLRPLEESRSRLTPSQQRLVDAVRWGLDGRWGGSLGLLQEYSAANPDDCMARTAVITAARACNQPRLALEEYAHYRWDPVQPSNQLKIIFFDAARAHHQLGQYEQELSVLRTLWDEHRRFHSTTWYRVGEARALVALGRLDECQEVIAKTLIEPGFSLCDHGGMMVDVAAELHAHGHHAESQEMAQRALDWFEATELPLGCSRQVQELSIRALSLLGRHEQAYQLAIGRLADQPDSWSLQAEVGVATARAGDQATAEKMSQLLAAVDEPFTMGQPSYHRAAIAAQLGQSAEAIRLLRQAIARGFHDYDRLHLDIDFDPLRDDPEFQEILRPKG